MILGRLGRGYCKKNSLLQFLANGFGQVASAPLSVNCSCQQNQEKCLAQHFLDCGIVFICLNLLSHKCLLQLCYITFLTVLENFLNVRNARRKFKGGLQFLPALVELWQNQENYSVPHYLYLLCDFRKCDYFCQSLVISSEEKYSSFRKDLFLFENDADRVCAAVRKCFTS